MAAIHVATCHDQFSESGSDAVEIRWYNKQASDNPTTPPSVRALATRGLLATDHEILNHGQVTGMTPELAPPLLTTTPHQWEDILALDRLNVHRCPTWRVISGTGLELVTRQGTVRYLFPSATPVLKKQSWLIGGVPKIMCHVS
ncbi:uncharacterized protein TNCV_203251 [Trichonephila clavipes]|nr:uncharacterized protein TNCV_203251 [Trichonephila clavipes]